MKSEKPELSILAHCWMSNENMMFSLKVDTVLINYSWQVTHCHFSVKHGQGGEICHDITITDT